MIPEILEIAKQHKLHIRSLIGKEVHAKCPFCQEDSKPGKKKRYYLSLNTQDQVYKCWFCGESGGVIRFISLLEGASEEEVAKRYRKRKIIHPAEKLTRSQRNMMREVFGYAVDPDWKRMKERNRAYYLRTLDLLWEDWKSFLEIEKHNAYQALVAGILLGKYTASIEGIRKREKEIQASILEEVLNIYSCAERPRWTENAEAFVREILKGPIRPETERQAGGGR